MCYFGFWILGPDTNPTLLCDVLYSTATLLYRLRPVLRHGACLFIRCAMVRISLLRACRMHRARKNPSVAGVHRVRNTSYAPKLLRECTLPVAVILPCGVLSEPSRYYCAIKGCLREYFFQGRFELVLLVLCQVIVPSSPAGLCTFCKLNSATSFSRTGNK